MLLFRQPQQLVAHDRAALKVEGRVRLFARKPLGLLGALAFRQVREVNVWQPERARVGDDLHGTPFFEREGRAQRLVPADHFRQAPRERVPVEPAREAHGRGDVVGRGAGLKAVEEPEALLLEGERRRASLGARPEGGDGGGGGGRSLRGLLLFEAPLELLQLGRGEVCDAR